MLSKKRVLLSCSFFAVFIFSFYVLFVNIPFRTALLRSVVKQNMYLLCEEDTLYSFGYNGVQKWLILDNGEKKLIANNDEFCKNTFVGHLVGRSGDLKGPYLYVACRSYLGGFDEIDNPNYRNGRLIVMRKKDLSIIFSQDVDIKLNEAKICNNQLVVSGMNGFNIYNITNLQFPKLEYSFRNKSGYKEFQGVDFFEVKNKKYILFSNFALGISIWDMTVPSKTRCLKEINIKETQYKHKNLPNGLQIFHSYIDYPHVYSTVSTMNAYFETKTDKRGIIVYNISNLDSISSIFVPIPNKFWYKKNPKDGHPSFICKYNNNIYTIFSEKGIAIFNIKKRGILKFDKTIDVADGNAVWPICINHKGFIFSADMFWNRIYCSDMTTISH